METIERFSSINDVRLHRQRLRGARGQHLDGIKNHWGTMREPAFTGAVVQQGFRDLWRTWRPLETLRTVAGDGGDLASTALGMALGKRSRSPWGRMLIWAASAVLPMVMEHVRDNERVQHFTSELGRSWERIKAHMRERREARQQQRNNDSDA